MEESVARGVVLFDAGAFYEAHEAWEERWLVLPAGDERLVLQGLIQIAAGLHKRFVVGDAVAAARLLAKGLGKLEGKRLDGVDLPVFAEAIARIAPLIEGAAKSEIPRLGGA